MRWCLVLVVINNFLLGNLNFSAVVMCTRCTTLYRTVDDHILLIAFAKSITPNWRWWEGRRFLYSSSGSKSGWSTLLLSLLDLFSCLPLRSYTFWPLRFTWAVSFDKCWIIQLIPNFGFGFIFIQSVRTKQVKMKLCLWEDWIQEEW